MNEGNTGALNLVCVFATCILWMDVNTLLD